MTKKTKNLEGFTLVELLIVVAVIGILAAITAPSLNNMIDRSRSRAFASGVANQYRLARNQAASTGQAFLVRNYRHSSNVPNFGFSKRGRVEVWAFDGPNAPTNCRSLPTVAVGTLLGDTMISSFDSGEVGGEMLIRAQSHTGSGRSTICVQPNGEFLSEEGLDLPVQSPKVASKMCIGEAMVIPLWKDLSSRLVNRVYGCASLMNDADREYRDEFDYWRVSLWDNGQVTVGRR